MKGYVVVLTDRKTGEELYMGYEMEGSETVGEVWPTKDFKETRIFFDEKSAADEIPFFKFDFDNYDAKVVSVDITSSDLPEKDFGISTIKKVKDFLKKVERNLWISLLLGGISLLICFCKCGLV